jgi:hypothetical protein
VAADHQFTIDPDSSPKAVHPPGPVLLSCRSDARAQLPVFENAGRIGKVPQIVFIDKNTNCATPVLACRDEHDAASSNRLSLPLRYDKGYTAFCLYQSE